MRDNAAWSSGPMFGPRELLPEREAGNGCQFQPAMESSQRPPVSFGYRREDGGDERAAFDLTPVFEAALLRWCWWMFMGYLFALVGFVLASHFFAASYTATAQVLRIDPGNLGEAYKPTALSEQTFASLLVAPELMKRFCSQVQPPISPEQLIKQIEITAERNANFSEQTSDVIDIALKAEDPKVAVEWANLYAQEAVRFVCERQQQEAASVSARVKQQLAQFEESARSVNEKLRALRQKLILPPSGRLDGAVEQTGMTRSMQRDEKPQVTREGLGGVQVRYADLLPMTRQQLAKLAAIEKQIADGKTTPGGQSASLLGTGITTPESITAAVNDLLQNNLDMDVYRAHLQALETSSVSLANRQRESQLFADNPPGYCQLFAPATLKGVVRHGNKIKVFCVTVLAGLLGVMGTAGVIILGELMDDRVKTASDLYRISRLPVLAAVGDLHQLSAAERTDWAFRTWTALQCRLSPSPNHGLICGITSSQEGEGRSTWIRLLAEAACNRGFRVLTITARPSCETETEEPDARPSTEGLVKLGDVKIATTTDLASLEKVAEELLEPDSQTVVHIPLPGWVWNLERRKQWQNVLSQWSQIDNVVILIELPAASVPEAVLLGENLPNMIWLASSGQASATETRLRLRTLRHARCNLIGSVLNREKILPLKTHFPRWFPS